MKSLLASFGLLFLFVVVFFVGVDYIQQSNAPVPTPGTVTVTEVVPPGAAPTTTPAFRVVSEGGIAKSISVDFAACSGTHTVNYAFGSSRFTFKGLIGQECAYIQSSEIEMGERTNEFCFVPVSFGKRSFAVRDMGIDMGLVAEHCSNE
ncbi:MAG TPA: hypothetical protein VGE35_02905 [Candidatus Paceibacterota bacterium]